MVNQHASPQRMGMVVVLLAAAMAAACAPVGGPAAAPGVEGARGHLLIVGGGRQPPELVARFVELAGGASRARIAVLPMASGEPEAAGREKADELRGLGADVFVLHLTREQAMTDS